MGGGRGLERTKCEWLDEFCVERKIKRAQGLDQRLE